MSAVPVRMRSHVVADGRTARADEAGGAEYDTRTPGKEPADGSLPPSDVEKPRSERARGDAM